MANCGLKHKPIKMRVKFWHGHGQAQAKWKLQRKYLEVIYIQI